MEATLIAGCMQQRREWEAALRGSESNEAMNSSLSQLTIVFVNWVGRDKSLYQEIHVYTRKHLAHPNVYSLSELRLHPPRIMLPNSFCV